MNYRPRPGQLSPSIATHSRREKKRIVSTDLGREVEKAIVVGAAVRVELLGEMTRPVGLPEQSALLQHEAPVDGPLGREPQGRAQVALLLLVDRVALAHVLLDALEIRAVALAELAHRLDDDLAQVGGLAHPERLRLQAARVLWGLREFRGQPGVFDRWGILGVRGVIAFFWTG